MKTAAANPRLSHPARTSQQSLRTSSPPPGLRRFDSPVLAGSALLATAWLLTACATPQAITPASAPPTAQTPTEQPSSQPSTAQAPARSAVDPSRGEPGQPAAARQGGEPSSDYPTAKRNFRFGPASPWPRLALGPQTPPGPLARIDPSESSPATPCATDLAGASMDIGPKDAWLADTAKKAASGLLSGLLRRSGFGFGGSGEPEKPPTIDDPIPESAQQRFHDDLSDIEMSLAGKIDEQGLLLSSYIEDAPDKSTFHTIFLERKDCRRTWPDRYLAYKLWLEWSLSVSWTKTTRSYRDGEMVSETSKSGGFQKSGEINLAEGTLKFGDPQALNAYQRDLFEQLPPPAWQQLGFSSPLSGLRGLGSQFDQVNPTELLNGDTIAVVHVTRVVDGRYVTRGMPFRMEEAGDGLLRFTRL